LFYWAIFEHKLGSGLKPAIFGGLKPLIDNKLLREVCSETTLKQDNPLIYKGNTKIS
jgi:hypothetical protein